MPCKEIYKFPRCLSSSIMNDVIQIRENVYNLWNLQALYSNNKKTVKFGTETATYRAPGIGNSIPFHVKNTPSI